MQKFLALTDVNALDPLPALGRRAPRDYELPKEEGVNKMWEFEHGDYSLPEPTGKTWQPPKKAITKLDALMELDVAEKRSGVNRTRILEELSSYFSNLGVLGDRADDQERNELAYKFFIEYGKPYVPASCTTLVRTATFMEVFRAAGLEDKNYFAAKKAWGVPLERAPTPEQYGAMLTWIEQNA